MKIVIATGIFPPEAGGPAYYAKHLTDALAAKGHRVDVVTYGKLKRLPQGMRHLAYLCRLVPHLWRAEVILALDTFSVALPAVLAGKLCRVPVVIRTGGDFLWEQYVERSRDMLPLPHFYVKHAVFTRKERAIFALTRFVIRHAVVVFSTEFQRDIWVPAYSIDVSRTHIINNAIACTYPPRVPRRKSFLALGRPLFLKNHAVLEKAFALARTQVPDIELETGLVSSGELVEKMRDCYAALLPSVSEISPNYILDALRCGKPFIQTKYSQFASDYADLGLLCDPLSAEDIAAQIVKLCDKDVYDNLSRRIAAFPLQRTYADVADDFLSLFAAMGI